MTLAQLLKDAADSGIELYLEGEQLKFRAHGEPLGPALKARLVAHKTEVIGFLKQHGARPENQPVARPEWYNKPAPLTHAQQQLYYLEQLAGPSAQYNMANAFHVVGPLNTSALETSVRALLERHLVLRTGYRLEGDEPVQVLRSSKDWALEHLDLPFATPRESLMAELAEQPFDLERGLPFRLICIHEPENVHTLLFVIHHIAFDGGSYPILYRELSALMAGEPLPPLPLQVVDLARWQADTPEAGIAPSSLDYWYRQLKGVQPLNSLASDRPRLPNQSYRPASLAQPLGSETTAAAKQFARDNRVGLFACLQAAFSLLIARWSARDEAVTGTPVSGRHSEGIEGLIGLFINTLPLRIPYAQQLSFRDFAAQVQQAVQAMLTHQDVPLDRLVGDLVKDRDPGFPPLIQILFALDSGEADALRLPGARCEPLVVHRENVNFELELHISDTPDGLCCHWNYAANLFESTTISGLHESFTTLLEQALASPETPVSKLAICPASRLEAMAAWQPPPLPLGRDQTFLDRFRAQVENRPQAQAVVDGSHRWTYAELDQRSHAIARALAEKGAAPGALVGLAVSQSVDMVLGIVSILKTGAAYLPLDPKFPASRLEQILAVSVPDLIVGNSRSPAFLQAHPATFYNLDTAVAQSGRQTLPEVPASELAYVIFTSGSTGTPKGVMVEHRSLNNFLAGLSRQTPLQAGDVIPLVTALSFDVHVVEVHHALACGACIAVLPEPALTDPAQLARAMQDLGVNHMHATPATWQMLIDHGWRSQRPLRLYSGGDALGNSLKEALLASHPDHRLWNYYGPTEATVYIAAQEMVATKPGVTVGRPLPNNRFYILDAHLNLLPPGVAGELYLGGANLARGYLNQPELTRDRFIPDPFREGEWIYRSGDLARWLASGEVEVLGRLDFQVKLNGHRIELGEIEHHLALHPAVEEAVVIATEADKGPRRLVGFVRPGPSATDSLTQELRAFLAERLPAYMVPGQIQALARMPLTANRKIDRKALAQHALPEPVALDPPRTEMERLLAGIWMTLLQLRQVDVHNSFFELGGHSLLAIKMLAQVEAATQVKVPLRTLLTTPTLLGLSQLINSTLAARDSSDNPVETLL